MARTRNHCCSRKATIHSVCFDELRFTVNYAKISTVAQQRFYGKFMLPAKNKKMLRSSRTIPEAALKKKKFLCSWPRLHVQFD